MSRGSLVPASLVAALLCLAAAGPAAAGPAFEPVGDPAPRDTGYEGTDRIVGGAFTDAGRWPWQVALVADPRFGASDEGGQICGGTLIHPFIILTAAHCVFDTDFDFARPPNAEGPGGDGTVRLDPNDVDVLVGRTTLSLAGGTRHDAHGVYMDSAYNPATKVHDLALISLETGSTATTIKMAGPDERALWTVGRGTIATGFGLTSEGGSGSDTLKQVTLPIVGDSTCDALNPFFRADLMVCAGVPQGGKDTCQGDSGGPLQAPAAGGIFRQVGVTSFGQGCARPDTPGVYVRVGDGVARSTVQGGVDQIVATEGGRLSPLDVIGEGARLPFKCGGVRATLAGTAGRDLITGTGRRDVLIGFAGADVIRGLGGNDVICAGSGPDRLFGGRGRDRLLGQGGRDRLVGGPGTDALIGGAGRDTQQQ